jgi:hypothetical protein
VQCFVGDERDFYWKPFPIEECGSSTISGCRVDRRTGTFLQLGGAAGGEDFGDGTSPEDLVENGYSIGFS